jgi:hypothetical protein
VFGRKSFLESLASAENVRHLPESLVRCSADSAGFGRILGRVSEYPLEQSRSLEISLLPEPRMMLHCDASYRCFVYSSTNRAMIREFTYRQRSKSKLSVQLSVVRTNLELTAIDSTEIESDNRTVLLAKLVETVYLPDRHAFVKLLHLLFSKLHKDSSRAGTTTSRRCSASVDNPVTRRLISRESIRSQRSLDIPTMHRSTLRLLGTYKIDEPQRRRDDLHAYDRSVWIDAAYGCTPLTADCPSMILDD